MSIRVLIVDDEEAARFGMRKALSRLDCELREVSNGKEAVEAMKAWRPHVTFLDLDMPEMGGREVLENVGPEVGEVIVVTADDAIESAVECMRAGATDYITKPFEVEQLRAVVKRNIKRARLEGQVSDLQSQLDRSSALGTLIGVSEAMRALFSQIERAATAPLDVLLIGETGTGKELIARELHRLSARGDGPFVAVNTSAITMSLAESELFGHAKGAFTGADKDREGLFQQAHAGTLFLDEIGDMPAELQPKLLRALQERTIQPVGSTESVKVDVRVVSATHQNLDQAVEEGHFREDLYYRVKGIALQVPPLRRRREDIVLLGNYFRQKLEGESSGPVPPLSPAAVEALLAHRWPGNVRELSQTITAAAAMAPGAEIQPEDLNLDTRRSSGEEHPLGRLAGLPLTEAKNELVRWYERREITAALERNDGNVSAAARDLGIHRQSLQQKMAQLGIEKP